MFTRWVLVMNTFERALYADPDGDLDSTWWQLVAQYQQVTPPDERRAPDWAAKIHIAAAPVYYHTYLYGAIVALQLKAALVEATGGLVDEPEAGALLRERAVRARRVCSLGPPRRAGLRIALARGLARAGGRRSLSRSSRRSSASPRTDEEERKTSYLELFFDLIFVFAFTQVTALILEDSSLAGFLRAALVLAMVWWAWSAYAWLTDAIDVENIVTRLLVLRRDGSGLLHGPRGAGCVPGRGCLVRRGVLRRAHPSVGALQLGSPRPSGAFPRDDSTGALVRGRGSARTRRRIRGQRPPRVGLARVARARRRRRADGGAGRVAHLAVALRRAFCADRDHRARGVDRGDRDRNLRGSSATRRMRSPC